MIEETTRLDKDEIKKLRVLINSRTPSWQRFGNGYAEVNFEIHAKANWLEILLIESGEKSTKQTMITINQRSAAALYRMLGEVLPQEFKK